MLVVVNLIIDFAALHTDGPSQKEEPSEKLQYQPVSYGKK